MKRKTMIAASLLCAGMLAMGSAGVIKQMLIGERVMTIANSDKGASVAIGGKPIVDVRSDSANAVSVVVYGGRGESFLISFKDSEPEPYQVIRTIREDASSRVVIYDRDGSVVSSTVIPK